MFSSHGKQTGRNAAFVRVPPKARARSQPIDALGEEYDPSGTSLALILRMTTIQMSAFTERDHVTLSQLAVAGDCFPEACDELQRRQKGVDRVEEGLWLIEHDVVTRIVDHLYTDGAIVRK